MANKRKRTRITTPFGRAGFCSLIRPSTKFQADGEFSAKVILEPSPETEQLIAQLQELYDQSYADALAEVRKDKPAIESVKRADPPFKPNEDPDTGAKLPGYVLNARLRHKVRNKEGVLQYEQRPKVLDSKNKPMRQEVGSGSIIRIAADASGFYTSALGAGVSLKLIGVQVKEHASIGVGDPGFEAVEGYEEITTASDPVEQIHAPAAQPAKQQDPGAEW